MPRIPMLTAADANDSNRDVLQRDVNLYYALGHVPGVARAFSQMGLWLRFDSTLDTRLRELAILTVGYVERAAYEWAHHIELGYQFGVTDDDIGRLIQELEGQQTDLEPIARHVIAAAREVTCDGAMSDASWSVLEPELGKDKMIELTAAIAFYCAITRVLKTLQLDLEPEAREFLERWPLPDA